MVADPRDHGDRAEQAVGLDDPDVAPAPFGLGIGTGRRRRRGAARLVVGLQCAAVEDRPVGGADMVAERVEAQGAVGHPDDVVAAVDLERDLVLPGTGERGGVRLGPLPTLSQGDVDAIAAECPAVLATTPLVAALGQAIHGGTNWSPKEMFGVGVDFLTVRSWRVQRGEFFTERDVASAEKVCVLGHTVAARLFQTADPLGAVVRIRNIPFRVVGVLERKGANIVGDDQDDILLMPFSTARKRLVGTGFKGVHAILVSARATETMHVAEREIRRSPRAPSADRSRGSAP